MTTPQASNDPFAAYQKPPTHHAQDDPFAAYRTAPVTVSAPDFTKGVGGTYEMIHPDGSIKAVPYSNVIKASGAGYKVKPAERERYAHDRRDELKKTQPNMSEPEYLKAMQLPEATAEKPGWWGRVENYVGKKTEPTTDWRDWSGPAAAPNPALLESEANIAKRVGRDAFGLVDMIPQALNAASDALSADPQRSASGKARLAPMIPLPPVQAYYRGKEFKSDWDRDPALAVENIAGDALGMWLMDKAAAAPLKGAKRLSELKTQVEQRYRPASTTIAGVKVPVGVGEEFPDLATGRKFAELKSRGVEAPRFKHFEARQQMAVKEIVRRTAQEVAGRVIARDEPAVVMTDAAEATFNKARPMYKALDGTLAKGTFDQASAITQRAIARAEKLGVHVDLEPQILDRLTGQPVSPGLSPKQIEAGLKLGDFIKDSPAAQPLTTFVKVRSELLKMQRQSADAAQRYAIGQDIEALDKSMDTALSGTPQLDNWKEASRLWKRGYALRSVAKELRAVTKGTPPAAQSGELGVRPTRLQGASLASRLAKLAERGVLKDAFTPDQIRNMREVADILDRAQSVPIGKGRGKGLAHAIGGAKGEMIATGATGLAGMAHGGFTEGLMGVGIVGGLSLAKILRQTLGDNWLAEVMTNSDATTAARAMAQAKTRAQLDIAIAALRAAGQGAVASSAAQQPAKTLKELQAEAAKRRPAASTAPVQQAAP